MTSGERKRQSTTVKICIDSLTVIIWVSPLSTLGTSGVILFHFSMKFL